MDHFNIDASNPIICLTQVWQLLATFISLNTFAAFSLLKHD